MKLCTVIALCLIAPVAVAIEPNFEIGGLVIDETLSRVGHLFYEEFVNDWDASKQIGTITVHERFDPFAGNVIWIDVNENTVFQDRVGIRASGIEEKAQAARDTLKSYLQQHKDIY
ncbi:MAG: CsgE family curli-type amyloid fiber assembly protein [Methylococcaceae bacterium]